MGFDGRTRAADLQIEITPDLLRQILRYDPQTGVLVWRQRPRCMFPSDQEERRWNSRYAGKVAFSKNVHGYLDGMVFRRMRNAHSVAWAIHTGQKPPANKQIDHINGDKTDNRLENLRLVSRSENCRNTPIRRNNKTGVMGVVKKGNRWIANIHNGKQIYLGSFETLEEAAQARKNAEAKYGFHTNHGRIKHGGKA